MVIRTQGQERKIRQDHCPSVAEILDKGLNTGDRQFSIHYNFGTSERLDYPKESKVLEVYTLSPNHSHTVKQLSYSLKTTLKPSVFKTDKLK